MPMILLINPKYPHNVGAVVRAASCLGANSVWFTGDRVSLEGNTRLPREERMRDYRDVELKHIDNRILYDSLPNDVVPVAVEIVPGAESLTLFDHPEKAAYVFGPEDGSINRMNLEHCHRYVRIPTTHCVNLSAAVYLTLYDRLAKRDIEGWPSKESLGILDEEQWLHERLGLK